MKALVQGESGTRSTIISVEEKTATVTHCWKKDRDAKRYELTFNYIFDVELEEVYRLAALWVNKDFQNRMRADGFTEKQLEAQEGQEISVTEMYAKKEHAGRDPVKAATSAFSKLSDEEKAALLEELTA